jgi:hypothetical protein
MQAERVQRVAVQITKVESCRFVARVHSERNVPDHYPPPFLFVRQRISPGIQLT